MGPGGTETAEIIWAAAVVGKIVKIWVTEMCWIGVNSVGKLRTVRI